MKLRAHQRPAVADTVSALTGVARAQLVAADDRTNDGFGLGAWVGLQRRRHANGERPAEPAVALDKLDSDWTCPLHQRSRRQ